MQIIYAGSGLVLPSQSLVPLEAVMWSQPITWAHPYLLVWNRAGLGQKAVAPGQSSGSPGSVALGSASRLKDKAAVACLGYFSVCAGVCVFLDAFKPELILQRAAEMWDVWSACVYVGGAPERADFCLFFFFPDFSIPHRERFFWGVRKNLCIWPNKRTR